MEFVMSKQELAELKKEIEAEKEAAIKKWEREFAEMKKELELEQKQWQNEIRQYQQHRQQQANLTVGIPCAHGPFQAGPVVNLVEQRWQNGGWNHHPQGGATPWMSNQMSDGQLGSSNDTGQWQTSVLGLDDQKKSFGGNKPENVQQNLLKSFGMEESPSYSTQPQPGIPRTDAQSTTECTWSPAAGWARAFEETNNGEAQSSSTNAKQPAWTEVQTETPLNHAYVHGTTGRLANENYYRTNEELGGFPWQPLPWKQPSQHETQQHGQQPPMPP